LKVDVPSLGKAGARFEQADLRGVDLDNADLRGLDLTGSDLTGANLSRARLQGTELTRATLLNGYCNDTKFWSTIFSETMFMNQYCIGADFDGAEFSNVVIEGGNLQQASFLNVPVRFNFSFVQVEIGQSEESFPKGLSEKYPKGLGWPSSSRDAAVQELQENRSKPFLLTFDVPDAPFGDPPRR
jgi:hypothetical protein